MKTLLISLAILLGACDYTAPDDFEVAVAPLTVKKSPTLAFSTQGGGVYSGDDYWTVMGYQNEWCTDSTVGEAYALTSPEGAQECVVCRDWAEVCAYIGCDFSYAGTTITSRQFCSNKACVRGACELPLR